MSTLSDENAIALLKELTETPAVPSFEDGVRKIVARELTKCGALEQDRSGNVYCECPGSSESPRVVVTGHMDEVGFMVQNITKDGFPAIRAARWMVDAHPAGATRVRFDCFR